MKAINAIIAFQTIKIGNGKYRGKTRCFLRFFGEYGLRGGGAKFSVAPTAIGACVIKTESILLRNEVLQFRNVVTRVDEISCGL